MNKLTTYCQQAFFICIILTACNSKQATPIHDESIEEIELIEKGNTYVKGYFIKGSIPAHVWKYYDENGELLIKKFFYNTEDLDTSLTDLQFFDRGKLVYAKIKNEIFTPNDSSWGKILTETYCSGCHMENEPFVGPPYTHLITLNNEGFKTSLKLKNHITKGDKEEVFEKYKNFSFLEEEDILQIKAYMESRLSVRY